MIATGENLFSVKSGTRTKEGKRKVAFNKITERESKKDVEIYEAQEIIFFLLISISTTHTENRSDV